MFKKKPLIIRKIRALAPIGHDFKNSGEKKTQDKNVVRRYFILRVVRCGKCGK